MKYFTSLLMSILVSVGIMAQSQISEKAVQYVSENYEKLGLKSSDIENIVVDHAYTDKHGISYIYLVQSYEGVPVYNAIMNVVIGRDGKVYTTGNRFVSNLKSQVGSTQISISGIEAIEKVADHFDIETTIVPLRENNQAGVSYFSAAELADNEIPVSLTYEIDSEGKFHKAYDLSVDMQSNADYWSIRVDASTGEILSKANWTVYCKHDQNFLHNKEHQCRSQFIEKTSARQSSILGDGASYRVYPYPAESPLETEHTLLIDPSDPEASPLGWHDTDGTEGAEYTITRGNNVHAYIDSLGNNSSAGGEPDGGTDLVFDFVHDQDSEPRKSAQAAQVNLFYANNFMHDFTYHLGFDEAAGNFQVTNYGGEGQDNDYVRAEAIDGFSLPTPTLDNANFSTPQDGSNGRMQMYLWSNRGGVTYASIDAPAEIAGSTPTGNPDWGSPINDGDDPITAKAVFVDDGTQFGTQGCNAPINGADIMGNIALVDRGTCEFGTKAANAANAGAVAVIICNVAGVNGGDGEELLNMGAGADGGLVIVPVRAFRKSDCDRIKASIAADIPVTITLKYTGFDEPDYLDGSFDNGVMAHEFAHGISNRLTGGPSASGCLPTFDDDQDGDADRGEQMGEGWSDYFTLITTLKDGDQGTDERGIGTYVRPDLARGIRRFPYSTDMEICPLTYDDIRVGGAVPPETNDGQDTYAPHPVGEVMAAVAWDLTWALIDQYGLDATWTDKTSGNYIAAKLVMDGMKLQPCRPGYVDARDAILFADELYNNGENVCTIWDVFARRGLGVNADQGSPIDHMDGTEDFTPLATCIEKLKVEREIAGLVTAGDILTINATAINHVPGDGVNGIVTEHLQEGLTYVTGSASVPATVDGDDVIFDVGLMEYDSPVSFTYEVQASPDIKSDLLSLETLDGDTNGFDFVDYNDGFNFFFSVDGRNGTQALGGSAPETEVDFAIISPVYDLTGDIEVPVLRFWHKYDLENTADAVFVSISTDNGNTWSYISDFLRNGYDDDIQYGTFAIPSLRAFTGSTNGEFIDSYIDLTAYKGENVRIRWRLGTDDNTTVDADFAGWIIDDIELMDLKRYEVKTCIGTSSEPEIECNTENTIMIDSDIADGTDDKSNDIYDMTVYPNPAKTNVYLDVASPFNQSVQIKLTTIDGKVVKTLNKEISRNIQTIQIPIVDIEGGMYLIQVQSEQGLSTRKFVKQ